MKRPLVSVIIPVWNADNSIRRMVSAILDQSFQDFELLLIDDGSTDDTLSVLQTIARGDDRISVFTKPNGGPSSARNIGLEKATGTYIQFYDSDDTVPSDALATVISAIQQHESDVLISGWHIDLQSSKGLIKKYKQVTPDQEVISEHLVEYIVRSLGSTGTLYNLWNKLFKADIIRKNNLRFREDLRFGEDLLFSLEYFKHTRSLAIIPDVTYHYQTNSKTSVFSSSSIVPAYRQANDEAIVDFIGETPTEAEYDLAQWLRWRWLMSYWSLVAASNKTYHERRRLISQFSPTDLRHIKSPRHIGLKNFTVQSAAWVAKQYITLPLFAGWLFTSARRCVVLTKLVTRRS